MGVDKKHRRRTGLFCGLNEWQLDILTLLSLFGLWFVIRWVLKLIFLLSGYSMIGSALG